MKRFLLCLMAALAIFSLDLQAAASAATQGDSGSDWLTYLLGALVLGVGVQTQYNSMTLIDKAKLLDPDGKVARIVQLLAQTNDFLPFLPFMQGNLDTGHQTTVQTGLPTVYWSMLNKYIPVSKGTTAQIVEQTGMLKAWSQLDVDLVRLGGQEGALRLAHGKPFLEAMNQEMQSTMFYGSAASPEEFIGLAPRYSSLSAGNADNIVSAGGTGSTDNTSIWMLELGDTTLSGITPKGFPTGLDHQSFGTAETPQVSETSSGLLKVLRDNWSWAMGIALMDWRAAGRICNIDVSNLSNASDAADLPFFLDDMDARMQPLGGKRVIVMNRRVARYLGHQVKTLVTSGGGITYETIAGRKIMHWGPTPILISDAILNTEDVVA
jgi:hypothetical protein